MVRVVGGEPQAMLILLVITLWCVREVRSHFPRALSSIRIRSSFLFRPSRAAGTACHHLLAWESGLPPFSKSSEFNKNSGLFFVRFRNHLLYVLEVKKPSCIDGTAWHYPLALESRLFFEICCVYVLLYSSAIRYQECSMSFFYKCMCYECRIFVHTFLFMVIHCQRI